MKYKNYYYINLKNAQVERFRGQFHSVPEALEYASKKYIEEADKPSLRGFMVLLEANGSPSYPVGYKHPRIPNIAMSRQVDITKAQSYLHTYRQQAVSNSVSNAVSNTLIVNALADSVKARVDKVNDEYHVVDLETGNITHKLATLKEVWDTLYPVYDGSLNSYKRR